jgi:hypothetical protein
MGERTIISDVTENKQTHVWMDGDEVFFESYDVKCEAAKKDVMTVTMGLLFEGSVDACRLRELAELLEHAADVLDASESSGFSIIGAESMHD